ncbi:MAG: hypothetical protein OXC30_00605 [Alphaproteobacteria bacterium]|nr:hypothetical protein [Alphaproteobacteria bacterium]
MLFILLFFISYAHGASVAISDEEWTNTQTLMDSSRGKIRAVLDTVRDDRCYSASAPDTGKYISLAYQETCNLDDLEEIYIKPIMTILCDNVFSKVVCAYDFAKIKNEPNITVSIIKTLTILKQGEPNITVSIIKTLTRIKDEPIMTETIENSLLNILARRWLLLSDAQTLSRPKSVSAACLNARVKAGYINLLGVFEAICMGNRHLVSLKMFFLTKECQKIFQWVV